VIVLHAIQSERIGRLEDEISSNVPTSTGQNTSRFNGAEYPLIKIDASCSAVLH
jgi:hypothetical protein